MLDHVRSIRHDTGETVEVTLKSGAIRLLNMTNSGVAEAFCKDVRVQCMRLGLELEHVLIDIDGFGGNVVSSYHSVSSLMHVCQRD